jgi:hypothetical protein
MRYVAKIHVLDVLDQVVISGYVHAYDDYDGEGPEVHEFTYQVPGRGLTEPLEWLHVHCYQAFQEALTPVRRGL